MAYDSALVMGLQKRVCLLLHPKHRTKFWLIYYFILPNTLLLFDPVFEKGALLEKMETISTTICLLDGVAYFAAYAINYEAMMEIIGAIRKHYDAHKSNPKDRSILVECHKEANKTVKMFAVALLSTGFAFALLPIVTYALETMMGKKANLMLPFKAIYPCELKGACLTMAYSLQIIVLSFVLPTVIFNAGTPVTFIMAIVSYLRLTQERFKEIKESTHADDAEVKLIIAIKSHQEALDLIEKVTKIETVKLFFQVFSIAAALSTCILKLSLAKYLDVIVKFLNLCVSITFHHYLLCYYGQKTIDEGRKLFHEIYSVPWYNLSKKFKTSVLFSMRKASKDVKLTAWGFCDLSLECFNTVMTSTFSYYTFLQTMSQ